MSTPGPTDPPSPDSPQPTHAPATAPDAAPDTTPTPPRRRLISGRLALVGSTFLSQGLRIGTTLVMARFVPVGDYGLYTAVLVSAAIITSIGDLGVPTALITVADRDEDEVVDTCVVIVGVLSVIHGAALVVGSVLLYLYAPLFAGDWRVPAVGVLVAVTSAMAMLYSLKLAVLNRRQLFGAESQQNMIFALTSTGTGIGFGLLGFGVFALVLQSLAAQVLATAAIWRRVPLHWPRRASWEAMRKVLAIGGNMSVANYAATLEGRAFDYTVLRNGGDAGKEAVGAWGRGIQVQALFSQNVNVSIERVVYTTMCAARDDAPRFREVGRRALETLLILNCYAGAWLFVLSTDIVRVVLGPDWGMVPPILAILGIAVPAGALASTGYNTCLAMRRGGPVSLWPVIRAVVVIPLLFLPFVFSMPALAWIAVGARYFSAIGTAVGGWRISSFPPMQTAVRAVLILAAAVLAGVVMHFTALALADTSALLRLLIASLAGLTVHLAVVAAFGGDMLKYLVRMGRGR